MLFRSGRSNGSLGRYALLEKFHTFWAIEQIVIGESILNLAGIAESIIPINIIRGQIIP